MSKHSGWYVGLVCLAVGACAVGDGGDENEDNAGSGGQSANASTAVTVGPASGSVTAGPSTATSVTSSSHSSAATTATASSSSGGASDVVPICDSGFVLPNTPADAACAACMGNFCCSEHKDCAGEPQCMACLTQMDSQACDATLVDDALFLCVVDLCQSLCNHLL